MRFRLALVLTGALAASSCSEVEKPVDAEEATDFKVLYATNCSGCHGADGHDGPGRPLNDPLLLAILPEDALRDLVTNGRPGTAMPAFAKSSGGPLTPLQVSALVNGIERNWKKPVDFKDMAPPPYLADKPTGDPLNGHKLFAKDCFMCHGAGGAVGSVTDPSYLAVASDQYLRTSMIVGRPDLKLKMSDWRNLNLGKPLSDQDIADLVSYLSSLRPSYSPLTQTTQMGAKK